MNIYQKLLIIQKEVMGLAKDKTANSYQYVTGTKVLDHIKPLMNAHGLLLKQEVLSIENVRQDYLVGVSNSSPQGRPKSEINSKVMMRFTWVDCETGEKDENLFGANGQNDWDKGVGSALTYAERYFLLKYFHIATDEDDIDNPDRAKAEPTPQAQTPQAPALPWLNILTKENQPQNPMHDKIKAKFQEGCSIDTIKQHYKVSKPVEEYITNNFINGKN